MAVLTALFLSGCATAEYVKNLEDSDYYYSISTSELGIDDVIKMESQKSGYIPLDIESIKYKNSIYPPEPYDEGSLSKIIGANNHLRRLGQIIALMIDADPRVSAYVRDSALRIINASSEFRVRPSMVSNETMLAGAASGVVLGAGQISSINAQVKPIGLQLSDTGRSNVMANNLVTGMAAGLIAGGIHGANAESTFKELISANSYEKRIEMTSLMSAHLLPTAWSLGRNWTFNSGFYSQYKPSIIKRNFIIQRGLTNELKQQYLIVGLLAMHRGSKYANAFPNTEGWEYMVSHVNPIELAPNLTGTVGGMWLPKEPEVFFRSIKNQLIDKSISL